jgi:hypothetical protein
MTAVSPWASPQSGTQQAPAPPPPPGPPQSGPPFAPVAPSPHRPRRLMLSLLVVGALILVVAAIAATAAITYAIARNTNAPNDIQAPTPSSSAPQFTAAQQAAAKQHVCEVFDVSTRGTMDQGGVRQNGQPNILPLIRTLNGVVAVEKALTPAVPADVTEAARKLVDANLELTTAAAGPTSTEEVNRLNGVANDATYAFADVCGLPH